VNELLLTAVIQSVDPTTASDVVQGIIMDWLDFMLAVTQHPFVSYVAVALGGGAVAPATKGVAKQLTKHKPKTSNEKPI
jgi:hypothetical protein